MKKILIIMMIIVFQNYLLAQNSYEIKFDNLWYKVDKNVKNRTSSNMNIRLFYDDGSSETLYYRDIGDNSSESGFSLAPFIRYKKPSFISFHLFINFSHTANVKKDENLGLEGICDKEIYRFDADGLKPGVSFNYSVRPIIYLTQPSADNTIGYDDQFNLSVNTNSAGFDSWVYNWQYHIQGDDTIVDVPIGGPQVFPNWHDMPVSTSGMESVSIVPNTFLPLTAVNKSIDFRIQLCDASGFVSENYVTYYLRKSAPKIIGSNITSPSCFDTRDGSIRVYFSRQLDEGERLSYALSDKSAPAGYINGTPYFTPVANVNNITGFLNDSSGYFMEIQNLPPGEEYLFEILGYGTKTDYDGSTGSSEYNGVILYAEGRDYNLDFEISRPEPVSFTIDSFTDVLCHGGSDGNISLMASGGSGYYSYMLERNDAPYHDWTIFSSVNGHIITGLPEGNYKVMVKDENDCVAREIVRDVNGDIFGLGKEITEVVWLNEPDPLEIEVVNFMDPQATGFTDGFIKVRISGGTTSDGTYNILWTDDNGNLITGAISEITGGQFFETLQNLGKGGYTATVYDENYSSETPVEGCTFSISKTLTEPDPLILSIDNTNPISCNDANSDDEFKLEDGELTAHAVGGVKLGPSDNGGLPYYYTWKNKDENGIWQTVLNSLGEPVKDSIIRNIGQGEYSVNIKDANGIVVGEYKNNALVNEIDVEHVLLEPEPITITFTKEDVYCKGGNNGWIQATIKGGSGDYMLQWNNIVNTDKIENLYAGSYTLQVTDINGCTEQQTIIIQEPAQEIELDYTGYKQPSGTGFTDGYIEASIIGGTAFADNSYNYLWTDESGNDLNAQINVINGNPGEYIIRLENIGKGNYYLTISDAAYKETNYSSGCIINRSKFELTEPDQLELTIEVTQKISCSSLNQFGNPYSNGELTAHVSGGVWLDPIENNGLPYYYTWKKRDENGIWNILTDQTDSIARNLDEGEYSVNIKDANGIILGLYQNNIVYQSTDSLYTLKEPPLLNLKVTQKDVNCFRGNDGWAEIEIEGGTPPFEIVWSSGATTYRSEDLSAGTYTVWVTDNLGCEAQAEISIMEPLSPVMITYPSYGRPVYQGVTDAFIEALVIGGTAFDDGSYGFVWTDENGTDLSGTTRSIVTNHGYSLRLENIGAGTYYLTVFDKNYDTATDKGGCNFNDSEFTIYEPIEVVIEEYVPVSCNQNNKYDDPFADGALQAKVTGGNPFSDGLPYVYHWKRQNTLGIWEELTEQTDSIAYDLSSGLYALNVEDSRGTVLGIYQADLLLQAKDSTFYFEEPELIELDFKATPVSCDSGNDGVIELKIKGGIPPYNIHWSNGRTESELTNLIAGVYSVHVTDSRGCEARGEVEILNPGGLQIDIAEGRSPICFQGSDGRISVIASGGVPPYDYEWNTGVQINSIENASAGSYTVKITDGKGCIAYKEIVLEDPKPVIVDLGGDRTLCNGQGLNLDVTIEDEGAQYLWGSDNGFSSNSSRVELNTPGIYTAEITTSSGCVGQDQIVIRSNENDIDAQFLLASQAFVNDEVILVNVSEPMSDEVLWIVPDGVEIIAESHDAIILKFHAKGKYEITMRSTLGDCFQDFSKSVIVEDATDQIVMEDTEVGFIQEFLVFPNPSDGNFDVKVTFKEPANASLRLISMLSAQVSSQKLLINDFQYEESYAIMIPSGTYILLLETPKGNKIRKVVIE